MEYITATDLRTQSSQLINSLKKGGTVSLVHRSQVIATIYPSDATAPIATQENLRNFVRSLKPKKLVSKANRMSVYRDNLKKKYGKNFS